MFFTSSTTAAAFLANMISAIPVIRSFALFMALLVTVNYLLVMTFFPAVVACYTIRLERTSCCCYYWCGCTKGCRAWRKRSRRRLAVWHARALACGGCLSRDGDGEDGDGDAWWEWAGISDGDDRGGGIGSSSSGASDGAVAAGARGGDEEHGGGGEAPEARRSGRGRGQRYRTAERFFRYRYAPVLGDRRRWVIIGVSLVAVIFLGIFSFFLQPTKELPMIFPKVCLPVAMRLGMVVGLVAMLGCVHRCFFFFFFWG